MDVEDRIRLEEFRQLKKEIRGSQEHLIVGIDVAKDKHNAFFGTANGKTLLKRLVFENNIEGFNKLLTFLDAVKVKHGLEKEVFGLEPTANYHKPLGEYLIERAHSLVLVSGNAVNNNREMLDGRWDKNDIKDAANVADLLSQGKCQYYDLPDMKVRDVRSLLLLRTRLMKQKHSARIRIRNNLVAQYFPELDQLWNKSESENLAIVRWCLSSYHSGTAI